MIHVVVHKSKGKIVSAELSGHAMSGIAGQDIVCAAVSALSITTVNNIERMAKVELPCEVDDGYLFISVPEDLSGKQSELTQMLLTAMVYALEEVASDNEKYVNVKIKN